MDFKQRKLPNEAAAHLRRASIDSIKPYAPLRAPAYLYLRRNAKFLGVKGPLDYFTADELERIRPFGSIFFPDFVDTALPFVRAAVRVRAVLTARPAPSGRETEAYPEVPLPPSPFEVSDAVIRIVGPLWAKGAQIEPFFVAIFVSEVCDALPADIMDTAFAQETGIYERAYFVSSWAVFFALHLGMCDLNFLNRLRTSTFARVVGKGPAEISQDVREIVDFAEAVYAELKYKPLSGAYVALRAERVAQKLAGRLERVEKSFIDPAFSMPTIYGKKGFADV